MQKTVLLVVIKTLFSLSCSAQQITDSAQSKLKQPFLPQDSLLSKAILMPPVLPSDFYTTHLPFFCDKELKLQKAIKFPVKFRVGSVEQCDRIEGKP